MTSLAKGISRSQTICMLGVPAKLACIDLLQFVAPSEYVLQIKLHQAAYSSINVATNSCHCLLGLQYLWARILKTWEILIKMSVKLSVLVIGWYSYGRYCLIM